MTQSLDNIACDEHDRACALLRGLIQPPKYLTPFIGREEELVAIRRRLQDEQARLLSLTGPGGCGKTRLAAELVTTLEDAFEDGLRWVELVGVSQPDLVPQTVSSALHVTLAPGQSATEGLIAFLRNRNLLLVLDNCEHLVAACSNLVTVLLRNCPYLQVLVTSRETLHVDGENVWPVPPISFPQTGKGGPVAYADLEVLATYPAVQLFVERAKAASPDFSLSMQSAPAVRHICRTLEGMPLALELAAARVKLLGVDQIAQRLDPSLLLLSGGRRGGDARHEALRDTIEWSYTLLLEQVRTVLQRAGIFSGGFTMEAAEVVCAAEAPRDWPVAFRLPTIPRHDIINLLGSLVNKSLIAVENHDPGRKRFRLLETIRHFALEKLQEAGEKPALRDLHLHYFLNFAEEAEPMLLEEEQLAWGARVSADYDNFQAALSWAIDKATDSQDTTWAEVAWTLASRLFWYWNATDQFSEGRQWLEKTLAVGADPTRSRAGATALDPAGGMAWLQGDLKPPKSTTEPACSCGKRWMTTPVGPFTTIKWRTSTCTAAMRSKPSTASSSAPGSGVPRGTRTRRRRLDVCPAQRAALLPGGPPTADEGAVWRHLLARRLAHTTAAKLPHHPLSSAPGAWTPRMGPFRKGALRLQPRSRLLVRRRTL